MTDPVIGFIGMTHLGLISGIAAAEKGYHVVCFDTDAGMVAALESGELPVSEPRCPALLARNRDRLTFTSSPDSLTQCDVIYVAPDVATDDAGTSDLTAINSLLDLAESNAGTEAVIVILSQVPPGFTRNHAASARQLYYQVETLVFGRAVDRALFPERIIVGAADPDAPIPPAYRRFLESFDCPRLVMRYESAELAKISINCCLVAAISTANTLAELCEHIGADWSEIVPALRLDARIGPNAYLTPGLGIAGGNLERDLATVLRYAAKHGTDAGTVSAWMRNSAHRKGWAFKQLRAKLLEGKPDAKVAVLGLAYKENTHSVKNSPSLTLLSQLAGVAVTVFDPVVPASTVPQAHAAADALSAVEGADAVAIMTPWDMFRELEPEKLAAAMTGSLILDPYRVLDADASREVGLEYLTLGVSGPAE